MLLYLFMLLFLVLPCLKIIPDHLSLIHPTSPKVISYKQYANCPHLFIFISEQPETQKAKEAATISYFIWNIWNELFSE